MKLAASLVLLAACNAFYGLDETRTRDAFVPFGDLDQDGVADERDNCRTVANAPQTDADGDEVGDACDGCDACPPCAVGPNHDEDGDHIADGCDPCPASAAPAADGDGDGIGDACDHGTAVQRRIFFDGFAETSADWIEIGARWDVANDMVTAKSGEDGFYQYLHEPTQIAGTSWAIETRVRPTGDDMRAVGIRLIPTVGMDAYFCFVARFMGTRMRLFNQQQFVELDLISGPLTLRMVANNPTGGGHEMVCSIVGTPHQVALDATAAKYPVTVRFYADRSGVAYEYIDVIAP
jgi:hypothetical protein